MPNSLLCYVMRYPDLLEGYCEDDIDACNWPELQRHWDDAGEREGRTISCKGEDTECYAQRYDYLWAEYCDGEIWRCDWEGLLRYWMVEGQFKGESLGCVNPDCPWVGGGKCEFACSKNKVNIRAGCADEPDRVGGGQCLWCSDLVGERECHQAYFVDPWLAKNGQSAVRTCAHHGGKCNSAPNCMDSRI